MRKTTLLLVMLLLTTCGFAQRITDKIDRGLVATVAQNGGGNFLSWRIFAEEYYDVTYNLYCNGTKIASDLKVSNYVHSGGNASSQYQVAPVVRGVEGKKCDAVTRWGGDFVYSLTGFHEGYTDFAVKPVTARDGSVVTGNYAINDISLADVTGDGTVEFIVKRLSNLNYDLTNKKAFNLIECYNLKGDRLWWIDCGPNLLSGSNVELNAVAYDWDRDGRAEVIMRGADNMIVHTSDGNSINIGDMNADTRWNGMEYTNSGREFLLYIDGLTGKPYPIGPNGRLWMDYPLPRYEVGETSDLLGSSAEGNIWGSGIAGHRPTKHYFGAPFLDGRHASIFLGRGCYTRHKFVALDVDPETHQLSQRWRWNCYDGSSPWFGNGYHNFGVADVDWDGRDEIVFGSMVIDDNGQGLSTTGFGHGDAQHCNDFDPYRHGQEIFACNETRPAMNYRDATTSKIYYRLVSPDDDGRALCGNFTNQYPGSVGASSQSGRISTVADKPFGDVGGFDLNFRIYWDGDLCEEIVNSPGTEKQAKIDKLGVGRIFLSTGDNMCNWTKNTPSAQGDIFGDWREELVMRAEGDTKIRIYTTNYPTKYRIPTLWHDHQYRQAMVWQMCGYNQPPHASFFLGEMENITIAPPPFTMTGRTEVANGGSISTANAGQHVIVCETNNTQVSVAEGANPHIAMFNVPSWVQGTNSNKTDGTGLIKYDYYTCDVTGGAFAGDMRLVKQGDGILNLPAVAQQYTGNTDIWAGTLNFDGTLLKSPLWLNRFAELNSNGGQFRSIRMDYASVLRPGGKDNVGNITVDSLRLGFGSRIMIDMKDAGEAGADINPVPGSDVTTDDTQTEAQASMQSDKINAKYLSVEKKSGTAWEEYGPRYLSPVMEFSTGTADGALPAGKYPVINVEKLDGNLKDIKIEGISNQLRTSLVQEENTIYLMVEELREASDIIWNGLASSTWNLADDENFTLAADATSTDNMFVTGDKVRFTDATQRFDVSLGSEMEADTVIVNNTKAYTFGGTGKLTGTTAFVKEGDGTVTMNNDNSYTGGNYIRGGVVKVKSLSNENLAYGNLGGVTTGANKFTMENGGTLQNTAAVTMGSPIRMAGTEGGCIQTDATFTMNKPFSGTLLTKKGGGNMVLYGNNSLTKMVIAGGKVITRAGQAASTVELQSGTLQDEASCTNHAIIVPKGKTATWQLSDTYYLAYANKLTGEGTLTINPTNTVSRVRITGNWSGFYGTIKHTNKDIWLPLDNSNGLPNGTLNIASGCTVTNVCQTFTIGKLTGDGNLAHPVANFRNRDAVSGSNTWRVGNDTLGDFSFNGKITDGGGSNKANFQKIGECKMTVGGVWDNTGTVVVNGGTLFVKQSACLGKGALTVGKDGTLSGLGSLTNSAYTVNGTLQPGLTATSTIGLMDFGGKNLTVSASGNLVVNASKCATDKVSSSSNGCSSLANIGVMKMNGTVTVNVSASHTLVVGDSIRLWSAKSFSGSPKLATDVIDAAAGLYWDDSRIKEGLLFVVERKAMKGDVNLDGQVDISDIVAIINHIAGTANYANADVNEDKTVDISDIVAVINIIANKEE